MAYELDRFWLLDYDVRDHVEDLLRSIANGKITCIVDEDAGGIVAYVVNDYNYAIDLVGRLND